MHYRTLIAAVAAGLFTIGASVATTAQEATAAAGRLEPARLSAAGPVAALDPAIRAPRQYNSWRPWTARPRNYGYNRFAPARPYGNGRPGWSYGRGYGAPYAGRSRGWQQPLPRWPDWRAYDGYRGYVAAPWRPRSW